MDEQERIELAAFCFVAGMLATDGGGESMMRPISRMMFRGFYVVDIVGKDNVNETSKKELGKKLNEAYTTALKKHWGFSQMDARTRGWS